MKLHVMRTSRWCGMFVLLLLLPSMAFGYGHYTVYSTIPADVYVDNEYRASICATQSLKLLLSGPQSYVIGVRAQDNGQTHKESVTVGNNLNEHREIHAFVERQVSNTEVTVYSTVPADVYVDNAHRASLDSAQSITIDLPGPRMYVFEVRSKGSNLTFREEISVDAGSNEKREIRAFTEGSSQLATSTVAAASVDVPQGGITREEMAGAIQVATAKAKAEALAEEAARRKRSEKRALTTKGIAHVVGVEANRGLPNSVKNMERIQLLLEALPSLKK